MQVLNYNWNNFPMDDAWINRLDHADTYVLNVCSKILKEISGHKKIKKFKAYCYLPDFPYKNKVDVEEDNITLLKKSRSLCFCKWNEDFIFETKVIDIEKIIFDQVYTDNKYKYFVICIKEVSGFYWKYEIIV